MSETIKTEPEADRQTETEKRDRGSDREAQQQTLEVTQTIKIVTETDRQAPTSIVLVMEVGIQTLAGHLLDLFQVAIPNELQKMLQVGLKHSDNHNEH